MELEHSNGILVNFEFARIMKKNIVKGLTIIDGSGNELRYT